MAWAARMDAGRRLRLALLAALALTTLSFILSAASAHALCVGVTQAYTVDWTNDEHDSTSATMSPAGPDGKLSLHEAVDAAEADSRPSTINLPAGSYPLDDSLPLDPSCGLTIQGAGARLTTIVGPSHDFVFANNDATTIDGVTITGGHSGAGGGALNNSSTLTLTNDAIVGNTAEFGGGVANLAGTLTISSSTISGNKAASGTTNSEFGGGIYNKATARIVNSTISGNTAGANDASGGEGGGIYTENGKSTTLEFVTLDHNQATGGGDGGDLGGPAEVSEFSTIFAGGSPNNCGGGAFASRPSPGEGTTVDSDGSCLGGGGLDPKLGPLQNNGGPTDTEMLLPGSPAIDGGELQQCTGTLPPYSEFPITVDQRGIARPQGSRCDVGAYELVQNANLSLSGTAAPNPVTVGQNVTFTFTIASTGPANDGTYPTLTDTLPAGLQFVSASSVCAASGQVVTCTPGLLPNGSSVAVTIVARAIAVGPVSNQATVASPRPDANAADDSATASTTVQAVPSGGNPNVGQILAQLLLSNKKFRAFPSGGATAARKKAPLGTVVSYTLTEPANVTFTVQRPAAGHRSGRKCVSGKPRKRKGKRTPKKCTLFKRVGGFSRQSQTGANHFTFTGRVNGRKLKPGAYRLIALATDSAGRSSTALTAKFVIVK